MQPWITTDAIAGALLGVGGALVRFLTSDDHPLKDLFGVLFCGGFCGLIVYYNVSDDQVERGLIAAACASSGYAFKLIFSGVEAYVRWKISLLVNKKTEDGHVD